MPVSQLTPQTWRWQWLLWTLVCICSAPTANAFFPSQTCFVCLATSRSGTTCLSMANSSRHSNCLRCRLPSIRTIAKCVTVPPMPSRSSRLRRQLTWWMESSEMCAWPLVAWLLCHGEQEKLKRCYVGHKQLKTAFVRPPMPNSPRHSRCVRTPLRCHWHAICLYAHCSISYRRKTRWYSRYTNESSVNHSVVWMVQRKSQGPHRTPLNTQSKRLPMAFQCKVRLPKGTSRRLIRVQPRPSKGFSPSSRMRMRHDSHHRVMLTLPCCNRIWLPIEDSSSPSSSPKRLRSRGKRQVRVITPYVGGAFGSKVFPHSHTILTVMVAQVVHRPVKFALTRQHMFAVTGYRTPTI